ncbi:hypothetical protein ZWY2020_018739 [Hordeum vulgare]|nr:hypothetical protein ZWY2020_018739 [Hordeum vulgare]
MDTEKSDNLSTDGTSSHRSSKTGSKTGSHSGYAGGNPPKNTYKGQCQDDLTPDTPTSLLRDRLPEDLQKSKTRLVNLLSNAGEEVTNGFDLLREMEGWDDDDLDSEVNWDVSKEGWDGAQRKST